MELLKNISLYLLVVAFLAAGINHFWHPRFYLRIMPDWLPASHFLNYASGVAEMILGLLLLPEGTRSFAAWSIAIMLLMFSVVHIHMLVEALRNSHYYISPAAAWVRLILQPLLIAWVLWHTR